MILTRALWPCLAVSACAAPAQEAKLWGGQFAEGYSSAAANEPVHLELRMFTASDGTCENIAVPPARLETSPDRIVVRVGDAFSVTSVVLRAFDGSGHLIPKVPINAVIWAESGVMQVPPGFENDFSITAEREGMAGLVFQWHCGNGRLQITVPVSVVP